MPDPTYEQRLQTAITSIETLLDKHYDVIHGGAAATVAVDGGVIPSLLKLTNDIAAQIVGGYNAGYVVNVADAAARGSATPALVGQLLFQRDTKEIFYGNALTIGAWTVHPLMSTIAAVATAQSEVDALELVVAGKMTKATYDPGNLGFCKAIEVTRFTANGTWTKPSGTAMIDVLCIGGGGGGGGGRRGAAATNRFGGGGGGAGAVTRHRFPANQLTADTNFTVTVGAGGTGGVAASGDSSNGGNGAAGGASTFEGATSPYECGLKALGGSAGSGGTTTNGVAGAAIASCCGSNPDFSLSSNAGGAGFSNVVVHAPDSLLHLPTGGGGGGGISSGNVASTGGGDGGDVGNANVSPNVYPGGAGGIGLDGGGGNGPRPNEVGTGGGGGAAGTAAAAKNGGIGGPYGGGGGGGGASLNGFASGAGGAGSSGIVVVICYRAQ